MNPKWRKSKVGEFLTKDQEVKDPKADTDMKDANAVNEIKNPKADTEMKDLS